jgi:hypothetical protein
VVSFAATAVRLGARASVGGLEWMLIAAYFGDGVTLTKVPVAPGKNTLPS